MTCLALGFGPNVTLFAVINRLMRLSRRTSRRNEPVAPTLWKQCGLRELEQLGGRHRKSATLEDEGSAAVLGR